MALYGMIREPPLSNFIYTGPFKSSKRAKCNETSLPWAAINHCGNETSLPWAAINHCGNETFPPWAAPNHCDDETFLPQAAANHCKTV